VFQFAVPKAELDLDYASIGGGRLYARQHLDRVTTETHAGKSEPRIDFFGKLLSWDLLTGKPNTPLLPEKGAGIVSGIVSPDGRWILTVEAQGYRVSEQDSQKMQLYQTDQVTGSKKQVDASPAQMLFTPDSRHALLITLRGDEKARRLERLELATGKIVARRDFTLAEGEVAVKTIAPDGRKAFVSTSGRKGGKRRLLVIDITSLKTLATLCETLWEADPPEAFPIVDQAGKRYAFAQSKNAISVGNLDSLKEEHVLHLPNRNHGRHAFSPEGDWLVAFWQSALEPDQMTRSLPDPEDLPQPRLSLFSLRDPKAKPLVHVLPRGYLGALTFSPDGKMLALGGAGQVHLFDWSNLCR
jgi:WD40 repeat protein